MSRPQSHPLPSVRTEKRELRPCLQTTDHRMTPLRFFLQKSMLSTDTEANDEDEKVPVGG